MPDILKVYHLPPWDVNYATDDNLWLATVQAMRYVLI